MRELSGGFTICPAAEILKHEIDAALWRLFPDQIDPRNITPLKLLGKGLAHASGRADFSLKLTPELRKQLPLKYQQAIDEMFQISMLSGVAPFGVAPRWDSSGPESTFMKHLHMLHDKLRIVRAEERESALYAMAMLSILGDINAALDRHRVSKQLFDPLGEKGLRSFIDDLPSIRVEMHLSREWIKNTSLQAKRTELNDWAQTAPMAMYSDVVVAEKLLADLLNRSGLGLKARVITDVTDLPRVLVAGSVA